MNLRRAFVVIATAGLWAVAMPASAESPRQTLVEAAFQTRDKPTALAQVTSVERATFRQVHEGTADREMRFVHAMALGYKAKLTRSRSDAMAARRMFDALAAADPRDAEAAAAVGTWHLDSVIELGGMVSGMAIGAKKATGLAMMDRAATLGGNRALYMGLGGLLRLALDPADPRGRALVEKASVAATPTPLDRLMQRSAAAMLGQLKSGDEKAIARAARQYLPFGRLDR